MDTPLPRATCDEQACWCRDAWRPCTMPTPPGWGNRVVFLGDPRQTPAPRLLSIEEQREAIREAVRDEMSRYNASLISLAVVGLLVVMIIGALRRGRENG